MFLIVIQIWTLINLLFELVQSSNNTQCTIPNTCEYYYDINEPISCYCGDLSPTSDELKLCFYSAKLKQNCSLSCNSTRTESVYRNLCCYRDCQPDPWGEWSTCQGPCGYRSGTRNRIRSVDPEKTNQCGGNDCPNLTETEFCLTDCCITNCQWSEWSVWSECSNTCGYGLSKRNRTYILKAACGGANCNGTYEEFQSCFDYKNIDCTMDSWSEWSTCYLENKICGSGLEYRNRSIIKRENCNGLSCGNTSDSRVCQGKCCKQDCIVSEWSEYGFCNVSCGSGNQTRTRYVILNGICGGISCPTNYLEIRSCEKSEIRDCNVSEWSNWSPCSNTCGEGYQTSLRYKTIDESCGGNCSLFLIKNQTCTSYADKLDCLVSQWSNWSNCFKNCNNGIKYRTRSITQLPRCDGQLCPLLQENSTCMESCSQLCNSGICSCLDGYILNKDNLTCSKIFCNYYPNVIYDVPNLWRLNNFDYVKFTCNSDIIAVGDVCKVSCANPLWVLRGDVANFTCQSNGQFNYQKMYCGQPNYAPTDITIDTTKIEEETSNNTCFATLGTKDPNGLLETFIYSFVDNFEQRLRISGNQLCLNYRPNYEEPNNIWFVIIKTTDSGNLTFQKSFNMSIIDINDPPTSCNFDRGNKIPENVGQPFLVGYLVFGDEDKNFRQYKVSIIDSDSNNFEVFYNGSQLVYKYGVRMSKPESSNCLQRGGIFCSLNYELGNNHKIVIKVTDLGTPSYTINFNLEIHLNDMNDAPISVFVNNTDIRETLNIGEKIASFFTVDEDNKTQTYTYEIIDGISDYFSVNKTNLLLRKTIDFEDTTLPILKIIIRSMDNGNPSKNVTSEIVFKPKNVNEPPYVLMVSNSVKQNETYLISVEENNMIDTKLATIYVIDPDINDTVSFFVKDINDTVSLRNKNCKTNNLPIVSTTCQVDLFANVVFRYSTISYFKFSFLSIDKQYLIQSTKFILTVRKINENPKNIRFFKSNQTTIEIDENEKGINISLLIADDDEDLQSNLKFSIIQDFGGNFEIINNNVLKLKTNRFLNYEADTRINKVLIKVTDSGIPPQSNEANLTIIANDVNEFPTNITLSSQKVYENAKQNSAISIIFATDPDFNETFTFEILSSTYSDFEIVGNILKISQFKRNELNYENKYFEILKIQVSDKGLLNFTKLFNITILDSNDTPKNLSLFGNFVLENLPIGTFIGKMFAFDEDNNQKVSYQLTSYLDKFSLTSLGILTTNLILNYEENKSYNLTVLYKDNGLQPLTSTSVVNIHILDINESPYFPINSPLVLNVSENLIKTFGPFPVFDGDFNEILIMKCVCIIPIGCECPIIVHLSKCINNYLLNLTECEFIITISKKLNFEEYNFYSLNLEVKDKNELQSNLQVDLLIIDVNEPISLVQINNQPLKNIFMKENERIVGKLTFIDPDLYQNHSIEIIDNYSVDNTTVLFIRNGLIKILNNFTFNYEVQSSLNITLQITDNSTAPLIENVSFFIILEDINEQPINIKLSKYEIFENALNGTIVANLSATDPDNLNLPRQNLTFTILDQSPDALEINQSELKVKNSKNLNFEKSNKIKLVIEVKDDGKPQLSSIELIELSILDANDPVIFIQNTDLFIGRNDPLGTIIKDIYYDDEDKNQSHTLKLINIEPDIYNLTFHIINNKQLIKVTNDSIKDPEINITILISDDAVPSMFEIFHIKFQTVNETLNGSSELILNPMFAVDNNIMENSTVGTSIGEIKFYLVIKMEMTTFKLLSEDAKQYFDFSNLSCSYSEIKTTCSLQMILKNTLNYEEKTFLDVGLIMISINNEIFPTQHLLKIHDINESPIDIKSSPEFIFVKENAITNELIGMFRMIDFDFGEIGIFEMVTNTDKLILSENGTLFSSGLGFGDESNDTFVITIRAKDKGNLTVEKEIILNIVDQIDQITKIIPNHIFVFENATNNQILCTFSFPDLNQVLNMSFIITKNFMNNFQMNENKLMLRRNENLCAEHHISCGLNFESEFNNITIRVLVKDLDMPANMNKFKISIQILDSNDSPTDINISNLDVEENVEIGSLVGYITVVDEDINDSFNCFLGKNSLFIIGENLTLRTNGTIDYETKHFYELSINCSDKWNISIVKEIELSVININEIPRQISIDGKNITLSLFIKENQKTGTVIGFIYSSDPDNDEHLDVTCHTENVMCQNTLCFNTNETGSNCITEIIINSEINFDYEMHQEIIFEVFVTDKENTSFSDFIKIVLLDVDEDPMDIRLNNSVENQIYLNENSVDIFVGTFSVDDVDKNENYNLQILHDSSDIFTMKINNELWLKPTANLDYETGFMNYFVIGAFKNGILALNKTYFINLIDLNEFPTSLSLSILIVPENLPQLSTIGKLSIVDIDIRNENHNFSFELLTYNTAFSISDFQLKLKENQVLNYESQSYYNLKINVIDYGIPILEKSFEISFLIQDINENPENLSLSGNEIYENSPVGSLIGIISCEDFDRNSHFTFNLNMNESNFFIENNKLFSGTIFDYEYRSSYHISITAFDNGDPKLNVSKEFEILILNQNEMPNIIFENIQGNETTVCKFVENNQFDMAIGLFKITDVDYQDNITCEIVTNGFPFYLQEISKSSNVTEYSLRVNESINYELKHYFPMTIKATDLKNLSKFMEIYIYVENINEPPTTLSIDGSDELYINITENLQGHYLITNFITTDPDENDVIQYFIANCTNCMEKFEFTNNNSQLFLKENQYFNYEKIRNKEIKLSVKAIDSGGLSIGVNVIINILDVNDPPIITKVNFSQIPSYLVSNISIGTFDVLDEDILLSSNQITCTILQPLEWLRIEDLANDNVLTIFSTETKYINQTSVQFNIECFDNGDPKQSTLKSFHVDTMNIGNEPLNILFEWIIKSVPENRANITLGKLLFLTKFSNKSVENTSSVVFVNASEEVGIEIKKDNSFILLSSLDYETLPKFSLSFTLIDRNGNQTISSMINIMDINEAPTAIKTIESNITVYEKLRNDIYIATIYVVDQDHNQEHICQISRILINDNNIDESIQTNQSIFKMIENKLYTGIDSASGLNANFVTNVSLEVQCHDDGKPSLSINNTLFINIVDVNEGPISIKFLTDVKSIFENITVNSVLVRFQVIDEDKNDIHHCQSSNSFFRISNYVLYLAESLDYELFPKIETVLICFDKGGLNASTIWQVVVDDVDEPPRNFNISNNQWNETSDIGNLIANLTATDPEGSECHFILNECSNFKCPFTVQLNGSIILNDTLINIIDVDQIIINVTISDIFGNSQNSLLTIYIIRQTLANISINFINNFDVPEDTPIGKALFEIKIDFLSEFRTKINCELFSSGNFCVVNEYNVILNRSLDYETDQNISATVRCFQNKIRMLQKKSILINIVNVDEPLKEVIVNITESLVEGNYTNKNIGNIIIKDPEFDRKSVKCTAFNIAMDFDLDQNCLLLTTKNQCELSFQIFLSGYFNYELLLNGLNISFECTDRVSKIEKKVTIIIENANDPPTNLILNGSLTVDLDTISNGAVLGNLLVVDEDEYQSHNIIIEYPGNKYFYIGDDNKLIVQNFEFAWAGSVNCTFDVSDNGLPQINKAFNLTFTFIKSTGEISLSNRFINITNKANTIIGKISFSKINSNLIGYQLSNIPNDAFSIINNELWLIKDAYQLPFTNITIRIRVIDSFSYVSISEGNIRLEIKGTSICHSNSSNCHKNATCISKNNSDEFQCFCNDGYEGNGTYCEEINECVINPCMGNSSFCINMINDFQCQCEHNRSGKTCEIIPITICSITDCFHGICGENKTCTCMSGWSGPNCNESIDDCIGNPCNNHGICEDKLNGFVCNCFENFTGILCEFDQNSCIDCNKNSEICIQLKNNETYCLSYLKMLYINFNMNDSLLNKFTNYQMDFYKFLLEISEFENYTIYFHINKLNSINYYQMNFTGIDNDENIISIDESRDIIKQHCNNENRQSSQGIICSGLFPVDSKTRKMASSLRILVIEYWIIILILWLFI